MRMTILAMPPVIPLVHDELQMSETQVGLLIGLPLAIFAIAAVPGSLLIARIGASLAVILGMVITAFAGAARAAAVDIWTLYAAAIATGFGVAIMQPGLPTLVREWMPARIAIGTVAYTSGMLMGATFAPVLTIPYVLPFVGNSWRLDLLIWAVPALLIAPVFYLLSPHTHEHPHAVTAIGGRWWPNWKDPLIWLLGLTFGSNNSTYFATNAFLGDYLASLGKPELLGAALGWLNGSQVVRPHRPVCNGASPAAARVALSAVRPDAARRISRNDIRPDRSRHHHLGRDCRLHHRRHADGDARFAAAAQRTRRRAPHRRRHVHHQLHLRGHHSDHQRRAVGPDRQAVDGLRAAVHLRRNADGARRDGDALSSCDKS